MQLQSQLVILDCQTGQEYRATDGRRMRMAAKRYTVDSKNEDGLTLLFAHCIGAHKEHWETTISTMVEIQNASPPPPYQRIREAWAFDWQSHGDSALLNEALLGDEVISVYEWAAAIAAFIRSPRMKGHRIVTVGHSAGTGTMMLTTLDRPLSAISPPYSAMIFIEPMMVTQELFFSTFDERITTMEFTVEATMGRRDTWPSREAALKWMRNKFPFGNWDPRILEIYVKYGLTPVNPDSKDGPVKLKTPRQHEALSYPDVDGHFHAPLELARVCRQVPVHVIWGDRGELVPDYIQEALVDISQGRSVASVSKIEDAGHMVPQEKPDALASTICKILQTVSIPSHPGSDVKVKL